MTFRYLCSAVLLASATALAAPPQARAQDGNPQQQSTPQENGSQENPAEPASETPASERPISEASTEAPQEAAAEKPADSDKPAETEDAEDQKSEQQLAEEKQSAEKKAAEEKAKEPRRLPNIGSSTSPMLPGQPWRVHDIFRPRPRKVEAPAGPVTAPPPGDAVVLFDGTDLSAWAHHDREEMSSLYEAQWKVEDGFFEVARGNGDLFTIENFGDVQLHVEWQIPENIKGSSQGRGNSGIKFLGLYEVQILDSYNNLTYADGQAASIYGQYPPAVNASRPPGEWQTYDVIFEMPTFEGDKLITPGYLTVLHNGVLVHHRRELAGVTGMRSPGKYSPHPPAGPIMLQDHGNPIRFRNIWARHLDKK